MAGPAVEVRDASKRFGALRALDGVSLAVEEGEFFALLGPNGAGKTTLISCLAGLVRPDAGRLRFNNHDRIGAEMAEAALRSAALNVLINLGSIKDEAFVAQKRAHLDGLLAGKGAMRDEVYDYVEGRL